MDLETDPEMDAETDMVTAAETEAELDAETDAETDAEIDAVMEAETEPEADTESETGALAEAEVLAVAPLPQSKSPPPQGGARVRAHYDAHLPPLSFRYGENLGSVLMGTVLLTLHGAVFCKNLHLNGAYWEEWEQKRLHVPTP